MTRRRDLIPYLTAYYAKRFPMRPEKTLFSDELLVLADMLMAQIDPDDTKPLRFPPMVAEGALTENRVQSTGRGGSRAD